jgi:cytochrome c biogenesis protein CcmG/thiol:disulfide interchange protein DsbE
VPCKIETPWLVALRNKYASQGVEIIGISAEGDDLKPGDKAGLERERAAAEKFVRQMKVPYPILLGGDSLSKPYGGLDSLPTSFYVNRQGVIVAVQAGLTSANEIESNIRKALEK